MATFELESINNVPFLHIHCSLAEVGNLVTDPYGFFARSGNPEIEALLRKDMPVTFSIFYWNDQSGLTANPNVCSGAPNMTANATGTACVCISIGVLSSSNHMSVYVEGTR